MANILVLHGPNLNLLGKREPGVYGTTTLETINEKLRTLGTELGHTVNCQQSNAEFELLNWIQEARATQDFIIINPAAYTHTSVALRDGFLAVQIPFIEVHLSNVFARESFRHHSYLSDIAVGVISGFAANSYYLALQAAHNYLNNPPKPRS